MPSIGTEKKDGNLSACGVDPTCATNEIIETTFSQIINEIEKPTRPYSEQDLKRKDLLLEP